MASLSTASPPPVPLTSTFQTVDHIPIEERGPEEVVEVGARPVAPADVPVYNPAFDITPHRYLTGIVTEEGICYPPFDQSLRNAVQKGRAAIEAERSERR